MGRLQVSFACLLLKMSCEPSSAGRLHDPTGCPTCPAGYFVMQNCSVSPEKRVGIRCKPCFDCSAAHLDTVERCSAFADSVCGNKTTVTETPVITPAVFAAEMWIIIIFVRVFVFLILLIALLLVLLTCYNQKSKEHKVNTRLRLTPPGTQMSLDL